MASNLSEDHALMKFFGILTEKSFYEQLGWPDTHVIKYVADLLVNFTQIETL